MASERRGRRLRRVASCLLISLAISSSAAGVVLHTTRAAPSANSTLSHPAPATMELTVDGAPVRVHALPAGTIQIKRCHHDICGDPSRSYEARFMTILRDDVFVEPMPIWTYLVEHPEGRFLIDTGPAPDHDDRDTWTCDRLGYRIDHSIARIDQRPGESVIERLEHLGVEPRDLDAVVVTHAHFDHTGSLRSLDRPTFIGGEDLRNGLRIGASPCRFMDGVSLQLVDPSDEAPDLVDAFSAITGPGRSLTDDGRLQIHATPGHTPGSLTVRLTADQGELWFVGDMTFTEEGLDPSAPTAGIHYDMQAVRTLHRELGALAERLGDEVLVLPSHDDDVGARMAAFAGSKGTPSIPSPERGD